MVAWTAVGDAAHMREFWDARARENALYFVDNRLDYRSPDAESFWQGGVEAVDRILGSLGVDLRSSDHVVEIGCGVGRLTRAIAARAGQVTAIDISREMLERARELNPHLDTVKWVEGDGTTLAGVEDSSADGCISHVVFQHMPDPAITLGYVREMGRVLRPGGWSAFQVSNDPSIHDPALHGPGSVRRRLAALVGRAPRGETDRAWIGSAIDLDELAAAAAEAGMELERAEAPGTQFCLVLLRRR